MNNRSTADTGNQSFNIDAAMNDLKERFGVEETTEEKAESKPTKKRKPTATDEEDDGEEVASKAPKIKKSETVACEANRDIAAAIKEMADIYFVSVFPAFITSQSPSYLSPSLFISVEKCRFSKR